MASQQQIKAECLRLFKEIKGMEKEGELMCLAFNKLPPKRDYPDYYVEIKQPIALDMIKGKITRSVYSSIAEFVDDIDLMCNNAQIYNMPESYIYEVAGEIKQNVHKLASESTGIVSSTDNAPSKPQQALQRARRQSSIKNESDTYDDFEEEDAYDVDEEEIEEITTPISKAKRKRSTAKHGKPTRRRSSDGTKKPTATASSSSSNPEAEAALDSLFQAIYSADLGAAMSLLETPGLPLDGYRRVVLKDPEEGFEESDEYQWGPLHAAACYGRLKVAQVLCDKGANLEAVDTMHGSTPLAWAAYTGRKRMAKCFVRMYNANVNARNEHGQLPIEIVLDPENEKWAEFLMPTDGSHVDLPEPVGGGEEEEGEEEMAAGRATASNMNVGQPNILPQMPSPPPGIMQGAQGQQVGGSPQPTAASGDGSRPIPQCIGGIGHQEIVHPKMAEAMKEIVEHLLSFKDEEGEILSEPFVELPDHSQYPEYYEVIHYPISLDIIQKRINEGTGYRSFDAFNYDMMWLFTNATFFNEAESQIHTDTLTLEREYKQICGQVLKKYEIPFDTSYNDATPREGRYTNRITAGEHDICVGDFLYIRSQTDETVRIAMVTRLRLGPPQERRKFIDGFWFMTPQEIPDLAGRSVYPHQLFVGSRFEGIGVRGICGKCFVVLPNVYARVYPQPYATQDVFLCDSIYTPSSVGGQPGSFKQITNWAHEFKTPLIKPPSFIPYIMPFTPNKQTLDKWNRVDLLPHLGMTVLNRQAAAQAQQARINSAAAAGTQGAQMQMSSPQALSAARSPTQAQVMMMMPQQQQQQQMLTANATPTRGMTGAVSAAVRPGQSGFAQTYQTLTAQHQQNLAKAQADLSQREDNIRKQAMQQVAALQQQNANFVGSPQHQWLMEQQTRLIEKSQQTYFANIQQLQQSYNQQVQVLNQSMQQQQQQSMSTSSHNSMTMSPISAGHQQQFSSMNMSSPMARSVPTSMMPVAATNDMQYSQINGASGFVARPGFPSSAGMNQQLSAGQSPNANAQAMMSLLLQHQQLNQQQVAAPGTPTTPKPTQAPLSPAQQYQGSMNGQPLTPNTPQQTAQNQQLIEQWKKHTLVFVTHGNDRIESNSLAVQILASDTSLFSHLELSGQFACHALQLRYTATSVLLRPVPGPFSAQGKVLLVVAAHGRRVMPRAIPDKQTDNHENDMSKDMAANDAPQINGSEELEGKEATAALIKNANYAYEIPLQVGQNVVDMEVSVNEWRPEEVKNSENPSADQMVPPTQTTTTTKTYTFVFTRLNN